MGRAAGTAGVLLAGGLLLLGGGVVRAQEPDPQACQQACQVEESRCIDACSEADDPIECEGACRNAADQCTAQCQAEE